MLRNFRVKYLSFLSNVTVCLFLEVKSFLTGYSFLEEEVKKLFSETWDLTPQELKKCMDAAREYYNGYKFNLLGKVLSIYNPVSIMNFLKLFRRKADWTEIETSEDYFPNTMHKNFPIQALEMAYLTKNLIEEIIFIFNMTNSLLLFIYLNYDLSLI